MKFILAQKNINGDTVGYYTETQSRINNGMCGQVIANITEKDAKQFDNQNDARIACKLLNEKCDLNLRVESMLTNDCLLSNKDDYNQLLTLLGKYSPEDIARAITYSMSVEDRTKIINELMLYIAGINFMG